MKHFSFYENISGQLSKINNFEEINDYSNCLDKYLTKINPLKVISSLRKIKSLAIF